MGKSEVTSLACAVASLARTGNTCKYFGNFFQDVLTEGWTDGCSLLIVLPCCLLFLKRYHNESQYKGAQNAWEPGGDIQGIIMKFRLTSMSPPGSQAFCATLY